MDRTQLKMLVVKIGQVADEAVTFFCVDTNAPRDYDGFGTFTIADCSYKKEIIRTVLVREEHLDWQLNRYASGNHSYDASVNDIEHVAKALWALWNKLSD